MSDTNQSVYITVGPSHVCNCVGCCRKCGSCRTAPWHTRRYCELLQQQARERAALAARQGEDV